MIRVIFLVIRVILIVIRVILIVIRVILIVIRVILIVITLSITQLLFSNEADLQQTDHQADDDEAAVHPDDEAAVQVKGAARVFVEAELEAFLREWDGEDGQRCGESDDLDENIQMGKDVVRVTTVMRKAKFERSRC